MGRLEVPGMGKDEFDIAVLDDAVVVSGKKRFEPGRTNGAIRCSNARTEVSPRRAATAIAWQIPRAAPAFATGFGRSLDQRAPVFLA